MRILLLAPDLLGESLALQLTTANPSWEVLLKPDQLPGHPSLVLWSIDAVISLGAMQQEAMRLGERWQPAPLLLLLPSDVAATRDQLLALPASGLLQNCDLATLTDSIEALLTGGRVVRLEAGRQSPQIGSPTRGFGQWVLMSGLQQISHDLQVIEEMLNPPPTQLLLRLLMEGRCRELRSARDLLLLLNHRCGELVDSLLIISDSRSRRA